MHHFCEKFWIGKTGIKYTSWSEAPARPVSQASVFRMWFFSPYKGNAIKAREKSVEPGGISLKIFIQNNFIAMMPTFS